MDARRPGLLAVIGIIGASGALAAAGAPLWTFGIVIAIAAVVAAMINPNLAAATAKDEPALEAPTNIAGALAVGALGIAAASAADNAVLGVVGVIAAALLLAALWLTREGRS